MISHREQLIYDLEKSRLDCAFKITIAGFGFAAIVERGETPDVGALRLYRQLLYKG